MNEIAATNIQTKVNSAKMRWDTDGAVLPIGAGVNANALLQSIELRAHDDIAPLKQQWLKLEKQAAISIYQRFDWIETYTKTIAKKQGLQPLIITGHIGGEMVLALPMAVNNGIIPKIGWIGGNHTNFNFMLINHKIGASLNDSEVVLLFEQIKKLLPPHGYLKLCCQPEKWAGTANALKALPNQRSTNGAFGIDMQDGFEGVLASGNGKRKRKKFRMQNRAAEKFGGARLVEANSLDEVTDVLTCFFRQKTERLQLLGIKDVFGSEEAQQFLQHLALSSIDSKQPLLKLYALEIDGEYRAIYGGGVQGKHYSAYFTSFANDALAHISPGEMLTYMLIKHLAEEGFESADLGCGEERFKHSWCSQYIDMFDVIVPLSPLSSGHVFAERVALLARRKVRETPKLWKLYKQARISMAKIVAKTTRK